MLRTSFSIILIILLTAAIYANSLNNSFIYDDLFVIVNNDFIKSWKNLALLFNKAYLTSEKDLDFLGIHDIGSGEFSYRPVVTLSYFIDYSIWKMKPFGYHLTNLLLHICNAIFLFLLATLIMNDSGLALLASLLFSLHPVNAEAVNCICFREDLLAFFFFTASLSFYIIIKQHYYSKRINILLYLGSLVSFLLALFSKEMAITLPIIIILYDYFFVFKNKLRDFFINLRSYYFGFFLAGISYLWVWKWVMGGSHIIAKYPGGNFYNHIFKMITIIGTYIRWILLPRNIPVTAQYESFIIFHKFSAEILISVSVIVFSLICAIKSYKTARGISFAIFWFFITLLPVYNIFPISNIMANRYLYIPAAAGCFLIALLLFKLPQLDFFGILQINPKQYRIVLIIIILLSYSIFTIIRNPIWKNDITLGLELAKTYPNNAVSHRNLAYAFGVNGLLDRAIEENKIAISLTPRYLDAHIDLGVSYFEKGLLEEAISEYKEALRLNRDKMMLPIIYTNIGAVFTKKGLYEKAIDYFETAIKIDPRYMPAYDNIGIAYSLMKNFNEAKRIWEKGLEINPKYKSIKINLEKLKKIN